MLGIQMQRPLAIFDIESTGTDRRNDRIVDLALVILHPDGRRETRQFRVNPEMPIPAEATAVHGIRDADVQACPRFREIAPQVLELLKDCDLGGYNVASFDIPMLQEEFQRAGISFSTKGRFILDAQRIYHRREPRDLTAALAFYCGEPHAGAHGALADAEATLRVLAGQFRRYPDLPQTLEELDAYCNPQPPSAVDRAGKLRWCGGEIMLTIGKHKGAKLKDVVQRDRGFIQWIVNNKSFPPDTREILQDALNGVYPPPPNGPAG